MSRPACQHGVPLVYDCPDCAEDMDADAYLAETYDLDLMLDGYRKWTERQAMSDDFRHALQQAYAGYADGATDPPPPPRDQRRKGSSVGPSQRP